MLKQIENEKKQKKEEEKEEKDPKKEKKSEGENDSLNAKIEDSIMDDKVMWIKYAIKICHNYLYLD